MSPPSITKPVFSQQINTTLGVNTTLKYVEIRDLSTNHRFCTWKNGTPIPNPAFAAKNVTLHVETEKTEGDFKVSIDLTITPRKLGSLFVMVHYKFLKYSEKLNKMVSVSDVNTTVICVTFRGEFSFM